MRTLHTLLRARLGFPWASMLLVAGCVLTTLPMLFSSHYYLILGAGNEQADNPNIRWWHTVVTTFVHGGGFPGVTVHLAINCAMLLVLGVLLERALGTGRFFALCATCLGLSWVLKVVLHRYAHGISSVVWAFVIFAPVFLGHAWRVDRGRAFRDPALLAVVLLFVIGLLGLVNTWHTVAMVAGMPFLFAWRTVLRDNLRKLDQGRAPDRWEGFPRIAGIALPALLVAFSTALTLAAVLGVLKE
jgi:membrane associated rhomboid family serine protease